MLNFNEISVSYDTGKIFWMFHASIFCMYLLQSLCIHDESKSLADLGPDDSVGGIICFAKKTPVSHENFWKGLT